MIQILIQVVELGEKTLVPNSALSFTKEILTQTPLINWFAD
jgi:hypothetical protein